MTCPQPLTEACDEYGCTVGGLRCGVPTWLGCHSYRVNVKLYFDGMRLLRLDAAWIGQDDEKHLLGSVPAYVPFVGEHIGRLVDLKVRRLL